MPTRQEFKAAEAKLIANGYTRLLAVMCDTPDSDEFGILFTKHDAPEFYLNFKTIGQVV